MISLARLGLVLALSGVVLALSPIVLLRCLLRRVWTGGDRAVVSLGALLVVAAGYAFCEPYRPEIVRVSIGSSKLDKGQRVRVVQLSDTHSSGTVRLEERLPAIVRALEPDVIVFTGDAVNEHVGVETFRSLMSKLAGIAPTYAVRGNWDVWWFARAKLFEKTGVRELKAEAVPLRVRGTEIWIAGVAVDGEHAIDAAVAPVPRQSLLLFLHHFPWAAKLAADHGADVVLAGDTHGGQMRLPLLGELVRIARHGVWRPAGLGREGRAWVYVNRGIGMEGGMPPVRFLCRPEVTVIDITGE